MSIYKIRSFLGLVGYYRRFGNELKLSIRGRIVGFRLRDMDSMVGTALTMEKERERERDRGYSEHSGCRCWYQEGGSTFF